MKPRANHDPDPSTGGGTANYSQTGDCILVPAFIQQQFGRLQGKFHPAIRRYGSCQTDTVKPEASQANMSFEGGKHRPQAKIQRLDHRGIFRSKISQGRRLTTRSIGLRRMVKYCGSRVSWKCLLIPSERWPMMTSQPATALLLIKTLCVRVFT